MTAATTSSNKKTSFFAVRFKNKLHEDMRLFIINLVLQLLSMPLLVGVVLNCLKNDAPVAYIYGPLSKSLPFIFISFLAFLISLSLGVVIPMINFRYLYIKSQVDMNYSLPLNNRQRFCADFFSGLTVFMIPQIIGAAIAGIEYFIGSRFIDVSRINVYITDIIRMGFAVLIGMIMIYTLSVFAICFVGSLFEAIFSIVAINIIIPVFLYLTWLNVVNAAHYGLYEDSFFSSSTLFSTSLFGIFAYIMHLFELINTGYDYSASYENSLHLVFLIKVSMFLLFIFAFAYILYKHRKAEDVSKPYVYNAFYYVIMAIAVYCIISALNVTLNTASFIAGIIISGILWFIMEAIRRRGFKHFLTASVSFAAVCMTAICFVKVIDITNGFGFAKKIPSASDITDVEISEWTDYNNYGFGNGTELLMHDPQVINDVIELNREILDRHFDSEKFSYNISEYNVNKIIEKKNEINTKDNKNKKKYTIDERSIDIVYYTKNGREILRRYHVPSGMLTKLFCDIYTSEEYAYQQSETLFKQSLTYSGDYNPSENVGACSFSIYDKTGNKKPLILLVEEGKELTDAIRTDMAAMKPDDLKNSEYCCSIDDQFIISSFENTIAFLEEHGITYRKTGSELVDEFDIYSNVMNITTENEYIFPLIYNEINFMSNYDWSDDFRNAESFSQYAKLDSILSLGENKNSEVEFVGKHIVFTDHDAISDLLDIASPIVIDEKIIAEVDCGKTILYVYDRPGYHEIVERAKDTIEVYDNKTDELVY